MEYIKMFENHNKKYYWRIRVEEPYFSISINKLNLSKNQKDYLLDNNLIRKEKYIYISDYYAYSWIKDKSNSYKNSGYIYKGDVEVTPEDIQNWEISKDLEKYNL